MTRYLFQLGHCPDLSHAEILSVNGRFSNILHTIHRSGSLLFADASSSEDARRICEELAGTIRLCELVSTIDQNNGISSFDVETLFGAILDAGLDERLLKENTRPVFGLSYLGQIEKGHRRQIQTALRRTGARLKERFSERERSCRFVLPDPKGGGVELSGAQVEKNRLLEQGAEIVIFPESDGRLGLALTRWLQPFEAYSQRDYGRPRRDSHSGMLPPKLARMMINLARTQDTKTLLDPFCGSGSVLMEAGLSGLAGTGFDTSEKAVQDSIENWNWIAERSSASLEPARFFLGDARRLHTLCEPLYFDACVTEPYLGPPHSKPFSQKRFERVSKELLALYRRGLSEIRTVVKPGARVVFVAPRFRLQDTEKPAALPLLADIKFMGYQILDPLNHFAPGLRRTTLVYSRPQQMVQREIFVLRA